MNKILKKYGLLTLAILLFTVSITAQNQTEILIVADKTVPCGFTGKTDCLQVKRLPENNYSNFFGEIENFRFIKGYFYVLEVRQNGSANSPQTKYRLRKILARVKSQENQPQNQPNFYGTEWKLIRIEGASINNDRAFIRFDEKKNSAGGNGGCNVFGGNMSKIGNKLKISEIISTKMFCENGSDVENKFFSGLDRVTEFEIRDGKLYLMANKVVILEFEVKK